MNYGAVSEDAGALLAGARPIIGSYGARGLSLMSGASWVVRALAAAGADRDVEGVPAGGYSFHNDHHFVVLKVPQRVVLARSRSVTRVGLRERTYSLPETNPHGEPWRCVTRRPFAGRVVPAWLREARAASGR